MRAKTLSFLLAGAFLLSACGFKLRGIAEVPTWLANIALVTEAPDTTRLIPVLKEQLKINGIAINEDPTSATYLLVILNIKQEEQITGIAASTTPRQYQLTYLMDFELKTRQGAVVQKPVRVSVTRTLTVNENRILGSNSETRLIMEEMQKDLAMQMISRLAASRR